MRISQAADIGFAIRRTRTSRGWSQAKLAEQAGVSRDWVVRAEAGSGRLEAALVLRVFAALGFVLTLAERPPADLLQQATGTAPTPWPEPTPSTRGAHGQA